MQSPGIEPGPQADSKNLICITAPPQVVQVLAREPGETVPWKA